MENKNILELFGEEYHDLMIANELDRDTIAKILKGKGIVSDDHYRTAERLVLLKQKVMTSVGANEEEYNKLYSFGVETYDEYINSTVLLNLEFGYDINEQ